MSKTKDRYKVNFQNQRTKLAISHMALGESRITRSELLSLAGKDTLYALKHSGYIEEREKGVFTPTKKLRSYLDRDSRHFSSSKSPEHSQALRNTLSYAPKEALIDGRYKTSTDIERSLKTSSVSRDEYLIPDYQLTLTKDELATYIENLQEYQSTINTYTREYELLSESIEKLNAYTLESSVTFNVEIVTSFYGNRELEMHRTFEQISQMPQIYLF